MSDDVSDYPRPYYTERQAAQKLGCDPKLLAGIANQRTAGGAVVLRAGWVAGKSGQGKRVYDREDVLALRSRLI